MPKQNKPLSEKVILERIGKSVGEAVGFSDGKIAQRQVSGLQQYKRKPLKGDETRKGGNRYVSPQIQQRVNWFTGQLVALFEGQSKVVQFTPNGRDDLALADQQTDVANHVLRVQNKHVGTISNWFKSGLISGLGVLVIQFVKEPGKTLPKELKALTPEQLIPLVADEEAGKLEIVGRSEPYAAPIPEEMAAQLAELGLSEEDMAVAGKALGLPELRDVTVRHIKNTRRMSIENLSPEDYFVSRDAKFNSRGMVDARLQGHKRVVARAELVELGFDEDKVASIPKADDGTNEYTEERAAMADGDFGVGDVEDDVTVYEVFTRMDIDGDGMREYVRLTIAGDLQNKPVLLNQQEVTEYAPYAVFTPFQMPNTIFGQSIPDLIGEDHRYVSQMQRWIMDGLAMSVNPLKIVNPSVTSVDDAMSVHPGKVIRSTDPSGGISYQAPSFTAMNAAPIMQTFMDSMDMSTGVGPSMVALKPSDVANTATEASMRNNASQTLIEWVGRLAADGGYSHMVRVIIDQLAQYPEDAAEMIVRLRGEYVPLETDKWNADLDITSTVVFGVSNKDLQMAMAGQRVADVQMAVQTGTATPQNLYNARIRYLEAQGEKNPELYYIDPSTVPPTPAAPPPPDPAMVAVENQMQLEMAKLEWEKQKHADQHKMETIKLVMDNDRLRDKDRADAFIAAAKIEAEFRSNIDVEALWADNDRKRNDYEVALAAQDQLHAQQLARQQAEQAAAQQQAIAMQPRPTQA